MIYSIDPDKAVQVHIQWQNRYANDKDYVLDLDHYGVDDYWAVPREFLPLGGDCEDYAITKYFSLRWLGFTGDELRVVIVVPTIVLMYQWYDELLQHGNLGTTRQSYRPGDKIRPVR